MLPIAIISIFAVPLLQAPWPCGDTFTVSQGNDGAHTHFGKEQYAWDFALPVGTPVLAAADGTVAMVRDDSDRGGCGSSFGDDGNYVVIDHGDGSAALYLHLAQDSSPVQEGQPVRAGDLLGRTGLTGWVCGAHLHFQVQSLCGSWYCQSQQAQFDVVGIPTTLQSLGSFNCVECGVELGGEVATVDEHDPSCFTGVDERWSTEVDGLDQRYFTAPTTDDETGSEAGVWRFVASDEGDHEVLVHVPMAEGLSNAARYRVFHDHGEDDWVVDQGDGAGWHSLGVYSFAAVDDPRIELSNATGEPEALGRRVAFDAVAMHPVHVRDPLGPADDPDDGSTSPGNPTSGTRGDGDVGGCACRSVGPHGRGTPGAWPLWWAGIVVMCARPRRLGHD